MVKHDRMIPATMHSSHGLANWQERQGLVETESKSGSKREGGLQQSYQSGFPDVEMAPQETGNCLL